MLQLLRQRLVMQLMKKMVSMIIKRPHIRSMSSLRPEPPIYAMNAGYGPHSYVQNSSYQRGILDVAKPIIEEAIATKLDIKHLASTSPNGVCIADFGCSTGHNSFPAIQIITQAIKRKQESSCLTNPQLVPEFHVFFNDVFANDFNTLFNSLPARKNYLAAGVPGNFYGRLLPKSSLHFAYSAWSLHWLSDVPKAVVNSDSLAWNKGKIIYTRERKEVCDAYLDQFGKDMESFLESRAVEMVGGGLMALLTPGVPAFLNPQKEYTIPSDVDLVGSCLMDMAREGRLSEAKVDSFNIPLYLTTPQQLKAIIKKSHSFSIERMEILNNPGKYTLAGVNARAAFHRAVLERFLTSHFGGEIIDELFDRYTYKLAASPVFLNPDNDKTIVILAVLRRT